MTWQDFITLVEADGITPDTRLAAVHWTARTGLVAQAAPETSIEGASVTQESGAADLFAGYSPQGLYTKQNELGEVEVHD